MRFSLAILLISVLVSGCRQGMANQARVKPLAETDAFPDGVGARLLPAHTVARGHLDDDEVSYARMVAVEAGSALPLAPSLELLTRGRERYDIHCAPCHDRAGNGNGIIVMHGFPKPPSLHDARLRELPASHYLDVINLGYGAMYPSAPRLERRDRWAVVAYIRALQLSGHATLNDVPPQERLKLESSQP